MRPILSLSRAAEKVAQGDLTVRAPVTTSDEVGDLAMTFNAMIERM
jgi:nitrogen fixation/metabolism regulation signal transduction histidine kinase